VLVEHLPAGNAIDRAVDPETAVWASGEITPYILAAANGIATPGEKAKKRSRVEQVKESKAATASTEPVEPNAEADGQLVPSFGGDIRKQALAYRDLINRRKGGDNG
jgi:hypothetical protein